MAQKLGTPVLWKADHLELLPLAPIQGFYESPELHSLCDIHQILRGIYSPCASMMKSQFVQPHENRNSCYSPQWLVFWGAKVTENIINFNCIIGLTIGRWNCRVFLFFIKGLFSSKMWPCFPSKQPQTDLVSNPHWQSTSEGFQDGKGD